MQTVRAQSIAPLAALFVAALLGSACIIKPFEADCVEAIDCGACLELSGCGWCMPGGGCVPGTSYGAEETSCAPGNWFYASCDEPSQACNDSCSWANDGTCDEPNLCDPGTDCSDCRIDDRDLDL